MKFNGTKSFLIETMFKKMKFCILLLLFICLGCFHNNDKSYHSKTIANQVNNDSLNTNLKKDNKANGIRFQLITLFDKDTLPKVLVINGEKPITSNEKKAHKIVWNIKKVRLDAMELAKKHITVYSEKDINDSCYQIAVYQLLPDHSSIMITFRVSKDFKRVQEWDINNDTWLDINK